MFGKKCKPYLCLSLGISGQIQHTVGIRDAKIIADVNKDKSAPIFEISDYGLVGELYQAIPLLIEKIHHVNYWSRRNLDKGLYIVGRSGTGISIRVTLSARMQKYNRPCRLSTITGSSHHISCCR